MSKIDINTLDETYGEGIPKRLTIGGKTQDYKSYRIPLGMLFYNDLNGRIATYEQEYQAENHETLKELRNRDIEAYNDIIADFVRNSANDKGKSFKKTKDDIRAQGQKIPGVVLDDGRIIDGNRRYTALRDLFNEKPLQQFGYFECVVLPAPDERDTEQWKEIKLLEWNLQFNEDEKRDYDRIDFLVSFYRDCVDPNTKMFSKQEYMASSGMTASDYEKNVRITNVMIDYLNWRQCDGAFYILKKEKLDGPLEEIAGKFKHLDGDFNRVKDQIYEFMSLGNSDRTREIRNLITSAKGNRALYDVYCQKTSGPETSKLIAEAVKLKGRDDLTPEETKRRQEIMPEAYRRVEMAYREGAAVESREKSENGPVQSLRQAIEIVNKIKIEDVITSTSAAKYQINQCLDEIRKSLDNIENESRK